MKLFVCERRFCWKKPAAFAIRRHESIKSGAGAAVGGNRGRLDLLLLEAEWSLMGSRAQYVAASMAGLPVIYLRRR